MKKIIDYLKYFFKPYLKIEDRSYSKQQSYLEDNFFAPTFYKKLMQYLWKNSQEIAEDVYYKMYVYDIFLKGAINIIISYILEINFEYKNEKSEIERDIKNYFKEIKLKELIERLARNILVYGYFCYYLKPNKDAIKEFTKLSAKEIKEIGENYIEMKDGKKYRKDNFLVYKNDEESRFGISPLLGLVPYVNNNLILLDAIRFTSGKFMSPAVLIGHKRNWNKAIKDDIYNEFMNFTSISGLPLMFYNREELDIDFFKPSENLYSQYMNMLKSYIEIIYMAFNIHDALTIGDGGSYAKAKIHENMVRNLAIRMLKIILEEIYEKLVKDFIVKNYEEDFLKDNLGKIIIIQERSEEKKEENKKVIEKVEEIY
ncbi:MAG: hypothetical protein NZ839_00530 [Endomicrobia bacterium]|nr:hypothetical protein [Endomicrobiia bacterium]